MDKKQKGYIPFWRCMMDNKLWLMEPFTKAQAWVDLVALANHKEGLITIRGNMIKIKRGQVGWSDTQLSKRWQWSRGKVERYLDWLEKEKMVKQAKNDTTDGRQKKVIINTKTILKYEEFSIKQDNRQTTDGRQTDYRQDKNKNGNNVKNVKNVKKEYIYPEDFEKFWELYPKKVGKKKAYEAWKKVSKADREKTMTVLPSHISSEKFTKDAGKFIPNPATWLNAGSWDDEIKSSAPKSSWDSVPFA